MKKVLSCAFWNDVLCSFRKTEKFGVMGKCLKCSHYERFLREMADAKVMDDVEFHKANFCWVCAVRLDFRNFSDVENVCRRCSDGVVR